MKLILLLLISSQVFAQRPSLNTSFTYKDIPELQLLRSLDSNSVVGHYSTTLLDGFSLTINRDGSFTSRSFNCYSIDTTRRGKWRIIDEGIEFVSSDFSNISQLVKYGYGYFLVPLKGKEQFIKSLLTGIERANSISDRKGTRGFNYYVQILMDISYLFKAVY